MSEDTLTADTPEQVTEEEIDPLYTEPFVDVNEMRREPVPHRYVSGGFKGTNARFSFYFPPDDRYEGRFFHNTYPLATSSDIGPFPIAFEVATGNLGFTLDSGAYYVQTNNGGAFALGGSDPSVASYRANAAAAKYSRVVAAELHGDHRPYGYLFGGSGGAYQTLAGAEHTSGVWDGFMPFVLGTSSATPSIWTNRLNALRVLRQRNKFPSVMDALNPGGSGDPYADLNEEERAALREATLMGYPLRGWFNHHELNSGYFANIQGAVPNIDPTYAEDFWSKPGYLGCDPNSSIQSARFKFDTSIARGSEGLAGSFTLASRPDQDIVDAHLVVLTGTSAGTSIPISAADGNTIQLSDHSDPAKVAGIAAGDQVRIDNSWPLALQTYHRHQVPGPDEYGWNQFRDAAGKPIYPQRDMLVGQVFCRSSVGSLLSGRVSAKTLLVQALMDIDALPWMADWYRSKVREAMGPAFEDSFALWFIDHTQHDNPHTASQRAHVVSLAGALQQGLRDLSRWVEKGVRPSETRYSVEDSQVLLPARAAERGGPQPVVEVSANGAASAEVRVDEPVSFTATIEAPPGAGKVVGAEWDFEGTGDYPVSEQIGAPDETVRLSRTHAYARPGTYFAVLRAASQREGDSQTRHARVQNIGRVRVVVS
jgi:hypothetical protein